jgi:serine O-acetyltransferase
MYNCEIHYLAKIGPGFIILHPSLGLVILAKAVIGARATFNGGKIVGNNCKNKFVHKGIHIGKNLEMGVNSIIIGPIRIAANTVIGANTIVTKPIIEQGTTVIGNPARTLNC